MGLSKKPESPMSKSSERMKEIRSQLGWNKRQLAQALGVATTTVAGWEGGVLPFPLMAELAAEYILLTQQRKEG